MTKTLHLPKLYAIVDVTCFAPQLRTTNSIVEFARDLGEGGVTLVQYRNKDGDTRQMLTHAREIKRVLEGKVRLIMNDRADICVALGFDGVHLGQDDLPADAGRLVVGERIVGVSTHNPKQVKEADASPADYIAIGPVFPTTGKKNPDALVGLEGVHKARAATKKPLVAIGGITRANAKSVIEAGADSVAVISDLLSSPRRAAEEFLRLLV
ncbi:MAG TPA: thiamine phosphate synthase [Candidatus Angelobacter sp.]|jgi:thiamine-phosphate pyrophosphorylase|nr:thiamine phosphate synthase [Candidatus Angelobacter sp.]